MDAEHIELAEAIAEVLTTFADGAYEAEDVFVPRWQDSDLATLRCAVVPSNVETIQSYRALADDTYTIDVGFAKRLQDKSKTELKALAKIVHDAFKYLASNGGGKEFQLDSGIKVRAVAVAYKAIFDPDRLAAIPGGDASGAFLSVFTVTYKALP